MSYLINELSLYLLGAAAIGALTGWFINRYLCSRTVSTLRDSLQSKVNAQASELEKAKKQVVTYKKQYEDIKAKYDRQNGDLMLMTSRWKTTLEKAKQLPIHQAWLKKVQAMYQKSVNQRKAFESLASHYSDLHADANQKIKRLNKRVTDQEVFKSRLADMIGKVQILNNKVTSAESDMKGLYGMISQIQSKWRLDRANVNLASKQQLNEAKADLYALQNKYQTEIAELQKQRAIDLAEQNTRNQVKLKRLQDRVNELVPLEGNIPGQDTKFHRFMDKMRLIGTSKNSILGRTYKQINEVKLEASEKERVFVDTCEEKDAVIDDLRKQLRTAESRAQASSAAVVQEYKSKISTLESELHESKLDMNMLREHEHTIEALKTKLNSQSANRRVFRSKSATKKEKSKAKTKTSKQPAKGLKTPVKGLKIAPAKVKDDLQQVKGIGPVMEQKLNNFGVYSYEQLGRLTKDDIQALAETLGGFPGRIDRDKWVSQSKKLHKKVYGEKTD
jgi:predicted flap endonuclease-1-like 5' DNA nuclease